MNALTICLIVIGAILGVILLILLIALIKTLATPSKTCTHKIVGDPEREALYAGKLARMIQYDTTSHTDVYEPEKFRGFHKVMEELYPRVFANLEKTDIDGNLLMYWKGKHSDKPLVLMSHQDVVPAEGEWIHEPFSGDIADGRVWGRGASDTKCTVMGFYQAVEELLEAGYVPEQDVYLSSSCTEEWVGNGCPKIVAHLKEKGVKPYLVCDEGGGVVSDFFAGIPGKFAMVGITEKGKADVKFTAKGIGGHSSAPVKNSPLARLSAFVNEVEKGKLFKKQLPPELTAMFKVLAPYAGFPLKFVFSNVWLFRPILPGILSSVSAQVGAMTRTTVAFTMASGSDAYNVIPQEATLGANLRFISHQGEKESLTLLEKKAKEYDLTMDVIITNDYTRSTDTNGEPFKLFKGVIEEIFPGVEISPYLMVGGTDARFYHDICDNVVRFAPVIYGKEQMDGIHGINENIETNCLPGCVDFYKKLIAANE